MEIISLLTEETVVPNLEAANKEEVLEKLINTLKSKVGEEELVEIRSAVLEREKVMSTGVGKGLAIPHGKSAAIKDNYAAFAILKDPVDYEAVDDEPVQLIFLLAGPKSSDNMHIKMLSRISRLMNNREFRESLYECNTEQQIIDAFRKEEQIHFGS